MKKIALFVMLAACASKSPPPATPAPAAPAPAPAPAAPAAPAAAVDCDDVCTTFAVCWEEVNGGDFRGGGACVSNCEEMPEADRTAWAKNVEDASAANDCKRLFGDEDRD